MTLVDFLLVRIAEDEAVAREAIAERDRIDFIEPPEVPDLAFIAWPDLAVPAVVVGPERVLVECEAKRRIVEEHERHRGDCDRDYQFGDQSCDTLRHLAAIYVDHPNYREEWRA